MVVLFLAQNIEITKFFFYKKTALFKNKIITICMLVEIKKVRWSTTLQQLLIL